MSNELFEKFDEATNVYRTNNYIVLQEISIHTDECGDTISISKDTYILRTIVRDFHYLVKFKDRKYVDGKRLHSTTYIRKYIDQ